MYLVDCLTAEIGVILDWVPAHFPKDEAGLGYFDGPICMSTRIRVRASSPIGTPSCSTTAVEVRGFLIANALFWLDKYHVDGLRVDAWLRCCIWITGAARRVDPQSLWRKREPRSHSVPAANERAGLRRITRC